jgi:hypothetical protein
MRGAKLAAASLVINVPVKPAGKYASGHRRRLVPSMVSTRGRDMPPSPPRIDALLWPTVCVVERRDGHVASKVGPVLVGRECVEGQDTSVGCAGAAHGLAPQHVVVNNASDIRRSMNPPEHGLVPHEATDFNRGSTHRGIASRIAPDPNLGEGEYEDSITVEASVQVDRVSWAEDFSVPAPSCTENRDSLCPHRRWQLPAGLSEVSLRLLHARRLMLVALRGD